MKKHTTIFILLIFSLFVFGCTSKDGNSQTSSSDNDSTTVDSKAAAKTKEGGQSSKEEKSDSNDQASNTVPVEVTQLTRGSISNFLLYSSTLETEQLVDVYSRIGGLVEKIYVEESEQVKKNGKLLRIERDEYILKEQRAHLEYKKQKSNVERLKALRAKDLLSKEKFENDSLVMEQAKISWSEAKLNLKYTTITSPISGVIGNREVRLGERINTNTKLFSIANLNEKIVPVFVPQDQFNKCYKKQPAMISSDAIPGVRFKGYVKRIRPIIDPQSGTFKVTIAVKDSDHKLRPGMFVKVNIVVGTHDNALLLPKAALVYENERSYFFVAQADSSMKVELQKGYEDAEKVEVLNKLSDTLKVVVLGQNGLKNGTKIKITEEKKYHWQSQNSKNLSVLDISSK